MDKLYPKQKRNKISTILQVQKIKEIGTKLESSLTEIFKDTQKNMEKIQVWNSLNKSLEMQIQIKEKQ